MMNVVVVDIIVEQELTRIPPDPITTVVVDGLCTAEGKQQRRLAHRHARQRLGNDGAKGIQQETLDGVVVERPKGKGDVEPVVDRVEMAVEEFRGVESAVQEVLPCVDDEARDYVCKVKYQA